MLYFKIRVSASAPESSPEADTVLHALFNWPEVEVAAREIVHFLQAEGWSLQEALEARVLREHELPACDPIVADLWPHAERHGMVISLLTEDPQVFTKCC